MGKISLRQSHLQEELIRRAVKVGGNGLVHFVKSWLTCGRFYFPASIQLDDQALTLIKQRLFVSTYKKIDINLLGHLGPQDIFWSPEAFEPYQTLYCKILGPQQTLSNDGGLDLNNWLPQYTELLEWAGKNVDVLTNAKQQQPVLFLDRDGVVIDYVPYITDIKKVKLKKGIESLLRKAKREGYRIVIVTNQSGLARGYYNFKTFIKVQDRMLQLLADKKCWVDAVYYSDYLSGSHRAESWSYPSLRKPRLGMLYHEGLHWFPDFKKSILIGDNISDMELARNLKIGKAYLLETPELAEEYDKKINYRFKKIRRLNEVQI